MLLIIPAIDENRKLWYDTLVWNTKRGRKEPLLMHWDIRYTEETGSTNEDVAAWGRAGEKAGAVLYTGKQTRGRGRMSRSWFSPADKGLYFSALLRPRIPLKDAGLLSFCAANAMVDALRECGAEAWAKWPNDVVIQGKKVCGILSVCEAEEDALRFSVIGCGVNLLQGSYPEELADRAACLGEFGLFPEREEVLNRFLSHLDREASDLEEHGFEGVRERLEARCITIGRRVQVSGAQCCEGTAEGIGDHGELTVRLADGKKESVVCGDVSVRGVMGYV